jgi:hypothetical protein
MAEWDQSGIAGLAAELGEVFAAPHVATSIFPCALASSAAHVIGLDTGITGGSLRGGYGTAAPHSAHSLALGVRSGLPHATHGGPNRDIL